MPPIKINGVFNLPTYNAAGVQTAETLGGYGHSTSIEHPGVAVILPNNMACEMPQAHSQLSVVSDETYNYYVSTAPAKADAFAESLARHMDFLSSSVELFFGSVDFAHRPSTTSLENIATKIRSTNPQNILFYTGAGISNADEGTGIWTYDTYVSKVGFSRRPNAHGFEQNDRFIRSFITDEVMVDHAQQTLKMFAEQLTNDKPTGAHHALTRIIQTLGSESLIATVNHDQLHKKTGLTVPRLSKDWHRADQAAAETEDLQVFKANLQARVRDIELVVVVGLSADTRGLLSYVRENTPNATFIACNNATDEPLPYLTQQDFLVKGDCQKILPELLGLLIN